MAHIANLLIAVSCALVIVFAGRVVMRRVLGRSFVQQYRGQARRLLAIVGLVLASILFIKISGALEARSSAKAAMAREAALAEETRRLASDMPEPARSEFLKSARGYLAHVSSSELPAQARGERPQVETTLMTDLQRAAASFDPKTDTHTTLKTRLLEAVSMLQQARTNRLQAGQPITPGHLWLIVFLLTGAVIVLGFLVSADDSGGEIVEFGTEMILPSFIGISILLFFMALMWDLDHPHGGGLPEGATAYEQVLERIGSQLR